MYEDTIDYFPTPAVELGDKYKYRPRAGSSVATH